MGSSTNDETNINMATLYLTKDETGAVLEMRNWNFWKALNVATENTNTEPCDAYKATAEWYVDKEDAIIQSDECYGIAENDEQIPISEYPSYPNPLITRPRFEVG